jgi:hypothetical protein
MKSMIDWNEIVPMLPKAMRDDLWLEAVTLLSSGEKPVKKPSSKSHNNGYKRLWTKDGPGGTISSVKSFIIHKDKVSLRPDSKAGKAWALIRTSKNDVMSYAGLASIFAGQKLEPAAAVSQLWAKGFIDVVGEKTNDSV